MLLASYLKKQRVRGCLWNFRSRWLYKAVWWVYFSDPESIWDPTIVHAQWISWFAGLTAAVKVWLSHSLTRSINKLVLDIKSKPGVLTRNKRKVGNESERAIWAEIRTCKKLSWNSEPLSRWKDPSPTQLRPSHCSTRNLTAQFTTGLSHIWT